MLAWLTRSRASWLLVLGGAASFFFYPDFVMRRTYLSENALLPGGALPAFNDERLAAAR